MLDAEGGSEAGPSNLQRSTDFPLRSAAAQGTRLHRSLTTVGSALAAGDLETALRHADRAWRLASGHAEIEALYGRLLLASGHTADALDLLSAAAERRPDPEIESLVIEALLLAGDVARAKTRLESTLQRFAVSPGDALARTATRIASESNGRGPSGWFALSPELEIVGEVAGVLQESWLEARSADGRRLTRRKVGPAMAAPARFCLALPDRSAVGRLTVSVDGIRLLGDGMPFPPAFGLDGRATSEDGIVKGWARLAWRAQLAPDLAVRNEAGETRGLQLEADSADRLRWAFAFDPVKHRLAGNRFTILARLPDATLQPLPDAPLLLESAARALAESRRPRRARRRSPQPRDPELRPIDVVIPLFGAREEALACIESVLATVERGVKVVAIDDASPDAELGRSLEALAAAGRITYLRNPANLGFPASANRGLALDQGHDVVLLNSDTVVAGDWLRRLQRAAYSAPDVGTATPLSNFGSIASYPRGHDFDCAADEAAEIDRLAALANAGVRVEIPTGVGFCLFVRRDCLADTGLLDAATFEKGYGEENDFCLRAAMRGWRHVLAADVYVRHAGGRSFGPHRQALLDRNLRILKLIHPGYQARIDAFDAADPIMPVRRRLDEARLAGAARRHVLIVTLDLPGGVERVVEERCRRLRRSGLSPLLLRPSGPGAVRCDLAGDDGTLRDLVYSVPDELPALQKLLGRLDVEHVELHHFLNHHAGVVELVRTLGAPFDAYIHDYAWICPRLTLIGGEGSYCGEPSARECERCIARNGSSLGEAISVRRLRRRSDRWLGSARRVIAPCRDAASRLQRHFPGLTVDVEPWEEQIPRGASEAAARTDPLRIAVIGAIGTHKGYDLLLECARDAAARRLPLEFVVFGYTKDDEALLRTEKAFVIGRYGETEIAGLLRRERPSLAWFASVWPETWCFALSHALRAGLPIVAFDLGAMGERLRGVPGATLVPLMKDPRAINDLLLETARRSRGSARGPERMIAGRGANGGAAVRGRRIDIRPWGCSHMGRSREMDALAEASSEAVKDRLTVSVQLLDLPEGLHVFVVRSGAPAKATWDNNLMLPAMHVGPGPGNRGGTLEFLVGPGIRNNWLSDAGDVVVCRVSGGPASILLTSLRAPGTAALDVEIQRVDGRSTLGPQLQPLGAVEEGGGGEPGQAAPGLSAKIVAHIQRRGDVTFVDAPWAGDVGQRLWIESFSIEPQEKLAATDIEYKGLTATGYETPWLTGGASAGTRGMGIPLVGFSVRLRAPELAAAYDCQYSGAFLSGAVVGPLRNGEPCRSKRQNDPLEAIQIRIVERRTLGGELAAAPATARKRLPSAPRTPSAKRAAAATPRDRARTPARRKKT